MTVSRRAVVAGLAAASAAPALAEAPRSPSRPAPLPDRLAGAFVPWAGTGGRNAGMMAWETWLGRAEGSVPALDYWDNHDWAAFAAYTWLPPLWARAAPRRALAWSIPLTAGGTPLAEVSGGRHDAAFLAAARAIAATRPEAVIRLGWEMNVRTMAWFSGSDPAAYVAAFRHVAALFRSASSRFSLDWCPSWGPQDAPADLFYPGDDVVDIVGLDVYDYRVGAESPERRWAEDVLAAPFGLDWQVRFSQARAKRMSIPEWGVGEAGDNAFFVEAMSGWLRSHADTLSYACYFDVDALWPTRLSEGRLPQSRREFHRDFGLSPA